MKTTDALPLLLGFLTLTQLFGFLVLWAGVAALVIRVGLAVFTGPVTCFRLKRRLVTMLRWTGVCLVMIFLAAWFGRFRPVDAEELPNPAVPGNRLFALKEGFVDLSINVRASDWPHTFFKPYTVGDAWWPEAYAENRFHWSKDGSVIVWQVRRHDSPTERYEGAYDYLKHDPLDSNLTGETSEVFDLRIRKLLEERGGVGEQVVPNEK